MKWSGTITLLALILLAALPATSDIYKYRTPDGRLVISNEPPPQGAQQINRREETGKPLSSGTAALRHTPAAPTGPVKPALRYIDHHPLIITKHDVYRTDVWWKKRVVAWVKNRSGRAPQHRASGCKRDVTIPAVPSSIQCRITSPLYRQEAFTALRIP
ncbi:hypothetical protein C2W62_27850 [Candidatus Entotheonella serta]|nr:hypothetical protein C2W62_27850 [Candidatus Entotheonella serta]